MDAAVSAVDRIVAEAGADYVAAAAAFTGANETSIVVAAGSRIGSLGREGVTAGVEYRRHHRHMERTRWPITSLCGEKWAAVLGSAALPA